MLITIPNKNKTPKAIFEARVLTKARIYIAKFNYGADGTALDEYLRKNYSFGLRTACHLIFNRIKLDNKGNEIVMYFNDPYYNRLARIITYGTGEIKGIPILREMFS